MAKTSLPPGFRFHPTDVELVKYYLKRKVMGRKLFEAIAEVDIYKYAPWDLPDKSCLRSGDLKWYFFCPREKKYVNGGRMNRATEFGYWKTTGKDRPVHYNNEVVGKIKTLIFHRGKAPRGDRTDWVMHEYRIEEKGLAERGVVQDAYVLCIVFQKEGPGPRNGAQYGAPFREEDWDDDDDDDGDIDCMEIVPSALPPPLVSNQINPIEASSHVPKSQCIGTSESCLSDNNLSTYKVPAPAPINNDVPKESAQAADEDDICAWLDMFTEDETFVSNEENQNEKPDNNDANIEAPPSSDGIDIYNGLGDLGNLSGFGGGGYNFFAGDDAAYNLSGGFPNDNVPFLELLDLDAPLNCSAEAHESKIICSEPYTDKNCYIPEHLSSQVNSCFSPPAMLPEALPRLEDQLAASLKENNSWGNPKEDALNHGGAATIFKQLSAGSSHASEDLGGGGGLNYPQ